MSDPLWQKCVFLTLAFKDLWGNVKQVVMLNAGQMKKHSWVECKRRHPSPPTFHHQVFRICCFSFVTYHLTLLFFLFLNAALHNCFQWAPRGHWKRTLSEQCWHSDCVSADATLQRCHWLISARTENGVDWLSMQSSNPNALFTFLNAVQGLKAQCTIVWWKY